MVLKTARYCFLISLLSFSSMLDAQDFIENQLMLQFKRGLEIDLKANYQNDALAPFTRLNQAHELNSINSIGNPKYSGAYLLEFNKKIDVLQVVEEYKATGLFSVVEPNYIARSGQAGNPVIPNDNFFSNQWQHRNLNHSGIDLRTPLA